MSKKKLVSTGIVVAAASLAGTLHADCDNYSVDSSNELTDEVVVEERAADVQVNLALGIASNTEVSSPELYEEMEVIEVDVKSEFATTSCTHRS